MINIRPRRIHVAHPPCSPFDPKDRDSDRHQDRHDQQKLATGQVGCERKGQYEHNRRFSPFRMICARECGPASGAQPDRHYDASEDEPERFEQVAKNFHGYSPTVRSARAAAIGENYISYNDIVGKSLRVHAARQSGSRWLARLIDRILFAGVPMFAARFGLSAGPAARGGRRPCAFLDRRLARARRPFQQSDRQ